MILTFDIGNTRTNIGLYENDSLIKKFWIYANESQDILEACLSENLCEVTINGAIIGSVVKDFDNRISAVLKKMFDIEPVIIGYQSNLPIKLALETPETLGVDRIINGAYAYYKYGQGVIVVDCGSAITFDIVNDNGEFVGGIISLGLKNQLKSLNISTSALPQLEVSDVQSTIGKNTQDAILSGVIRGTASMIDGMIANCIEELKSTPKIILTGGDAPVLSKYITSNIDIIDVDFTLKGLGYLYSLNRV